MEYHMFPFIVTFA